MEISFATRRLEKTFNTERELTRRFGDRMARTMMVRMVVLRNAAILSDVPVTRPGRRHQLTQDRDELFAVDLVHPQRLVFEPNHNPIPREDDGWIDTDRVTAITIIEVID